MTERRAVFAAALEQAESLFMAASAADLGIRPMLLFYGMSQASRAVAAAAVAAELDAADRWRLQGHGLSCSGVGVRCESLAEVRISPRKGWSTFTTMQHVLGSPRWTKDVELSAILAAEPTLPDFEGRDDWPALLVIANVEPGPAGWNQTVHHVTQYALGAPDRKTWDRYSDIPNHYSVLRGTEVRPSGPQWPLTDGFHTTLIAHVPEAIQPECGYDGTMLPEMLTPDLAGASGQQHPFVLWWAALFALSMRARYEPEGWTHDLDPDGSEYAPLLHEALTSALTECPRLIHAALDHVSSRQ